MAPPRVLGQLQQLLAGLHRGDLVHRGPLGAAEFVEGLLDGGADDGHAVPRHHQDGLVAQHAGIAVALVQRDRAGRLVVIGDAVIEGEVVHVRELEPPAVDHRQRRQVLRMDVQHRHRLGIGEVDTGMDDEGDFAELARARDHIAVQIADDQVGCGDLLEQEAARVDQEQGLVAAARQHDRVMVADLLVPVVPRMDAEHGGEVGAELPLRLFLGRGRAGADGDGGHGGGLRRGRHLECHAPETVSNRKRGLRTRRSGSLAFAVSSPLRGCGPAPLGRPVRICDFAAAREPYIDRACDQGLRRARDRRDHILAGMITE